MKNITILAFIVMFLLTIGSAISCDYSWAMDTSCKEVVGLQNNCSTYDVYDSSGVLFLENQSMNYDNETPIIFFYDYQLNFNASGLYTLKFCDNATWTQIHISPLYEYAQSLSGGVIGGNTIMVIGLIIALVFLLLVGEYFNNFICRVITAFGFLFIGMENLNSSYVYWMLLLFGTLWFIRAILVFNKE